MPDDALIAIEVSLCEDVKIYFVGVHCVDLSSRVTGMIICRLFYFSLLSQCITLSCSGIEDVGYGIRMCTFLQHKQGRHSKHAHGPIL